MSKMDCLIKSARAVTTPTAILDQAYKRRREHNNSNDVVELSRPSYRASWSCHQHSQTSARAGLVCWIRMTSKNLMWGSLPDFIHSHQSSMLPSFSSPTFPSQKLPPSSTPSCFHFSLSTQLRWRCSLPSKATDPRYYILKPFRLSKGLHKEG